MNGISPTAPDPAGHDGHGEGSGGRGGPDGRNGTGDPGRTRPEAGGPGRTGTDRAGAAPGGRAPEAGPGPGPAGPDAPDRPDEPGGPGGAAGPEVPGPVVPPGPARSTGPRPDEPAPTFDLTGTLATSDTGTAPGATAPAGEGEGGTGPDATRTDAAAGPGATGATGAAGAPGATVTGSTTTGARAGTARTGSTRTGGGRTGPSGARTGGGAEGTAAVPGGGSDGAPGAVGTGSPAAAGGTGGAGTPAPSGGNGGNGGTGAAVAAVAADAAGTPAPAVAATEMFVSEEPWGPGPQGYHASDVERWAPEPDKRPGRTAFQRDRGRVLHSAALRRLAGKTQVVTPGTSPHSWDATPRTRLTHSLECAQIGRELGAALGGDPDLVEVACLAHDLGHPPFGHNGERALHEVAAGCGGFEGNAQSLRLLTRLEPKRFIADQETGEPVSVGLNLTRAALDAATKYPWPRGGHPTDPASGKFGVYEDDMPVFRWVRQGAPAGRTCFEAQIMDWADDVAYSVHDVEDGLHAGHLDPACLLAEPERREVFAVAAHRYAPGADPEELAEALDRLLDQEWWPHGYDGTAVAQARLKDATSQLIGRFCLAAEAATRAVWGTGRLTRYRADLVVPRATRLECAVLKAVADRYVMQREDQELIRAEQRVIIAELGERLVARAPDGLDPQFRTLYARAGGDAERLRVIVDQIASLTDASARSLHARLTRPPSG